MISARPPFESPGLTLAEVEEEDFSGMALATQLGAGISFSLGNRVDLFAGYRLFGTSGIDADDGDFITQFNLRSHNIDAGARLYF